MWISIHLALTVIPCRLTLAVFNSVFSSLMEDEFSRGVTERTSLLLTNYSFTYSVLALSFDTAVYLLINNQFDILSYLSTFGVTVFDIQKILERFINKLNQQSSYLIYGDVLHHYVKVFLLLYLFFKWLLLLFFMWLWLRMRMRLS